MKRRVLSILTTLALMAGLCTPLGGLVPEAEAAGYKTYGVLEYGTVTSTGKPGERDPNGLYQVIEACDPNATGAIVIPSEIDGLPVKEIDSYAFDGCSGITSVYVPGSVELIGQRAFRDCTSLESVTLCDGLLRIRGYAFEGCTSLTSIVIPSTVESLWSDSLSTTRGHTFLDCTSLREVFILSRNVALESSYALNSMYTPYYSDLFENCAEDLVIYGYAGSTAEEYAGYSWYNLAFSVLDESFEWTPDLPEEENQPTGAIPIPILNDPTCTEEGVSLSWTLPLEVPGETQTVDGFCILRKTAGGSYQPIDQVGEYTHSYVDTSVQEGQTYTYTVQVYYQDQTGDCDQNGRTILFVRPEAELTMTVDLTGGTGDWSNLLPLYKGNGQSGRFDLTLGTEKEWLEHRPELFNESTAEFYGSLKLLDMDGNIVYTQDAPLTYGGTDSGVPLVEVPIDYDKFQQLPLEADTTLICTLYDLSGERLSSAPVYTSPFQRWSFTNYSTDIPEQLVIEMFGASKGKQLLQQAKNSGFTMGDDGLCFGMVTLTSLVNAGHIPASSFDGCQVLDQVQKNTKLSNISNVEDADELIQMAHLLQYKPDVQSQLAEHRGDFEGLKELVDGFQAGRNPMPVLYMEDGNKHTVCVYDYSENAYVYYFRIYDASIMDGLGTVRVEKSSGVWSYADWDGGKDDITYYEVADINKWTDLGEGYALLSTEAYDVFGFFNVVSISWIANAAQSAAQSEGGPNLYWISGSQSVELSGPGSIADDHAIYDITAVDSCTFALHRGQVNQVSAAGQELKLQCVYPGKDGTDITVAYTGENQGEDPVVLTYDPDKDTVCISGAEKGTVTVTYENGKTWTEQVEPGQDLTVSADGENTPSAAGGTSASEGGNNTEGSSSGTAVSSFRDVSSSAYYADAVRWAVEQGITAGTSETTFSPDAPCTRAQVVTFLWRTDFPPKQITGPVGFRDVHVGDYFWFPVKWALEMDITAGTSADTFSPDDPCTRAQVITFLYRYLGEATQA